MDGSRRVDCGRRGSDFGRPTSSSEVTLRRDVGVDPPVKVHQLQSACTDRPPAAVPPAGQSQPTPITVTELGQSLRLAPGLAVWRKRSSEVADESILGPPVASVRSRCSRPRHRATSRRRTDRRDWTRRSLSVYLAGSFGGSGGGMQTLARYSSCQCSPCCELPNVRL